MIAMSKSEMSIPDIRALLCGDVVYIALNALRRVLPLCHHYRIVSPKLLASIVVFIDATLHFPLAESAGFHQ